MRIILDLQACQASSMHRGIGRYSMALALAMARNSGGHELRIVLNDDYPDTVAALRRAFDGLLPQSHISTFSVPVPAGEVDPRNAWRVRTAERIREHYLASLRPDVVHVASLFEGLGDNAVSSVPRPGGRFDTAVTLYDLIPLMRKERYLGDPNVAAWYHRKLEGMQRADLLLAISASAREEGIALLGMPAERVVNISSAVDSMFQARALTTDARAALLARYGLSRPFIMYTGGIDYRKNIEGLVEAYARLPATLRKQYQLAIVCSIQNPDRFRLERLAAKFGLAKDDLVLTGFVPDDDLVSLYNCTALFVFPSLHEGFGLPALEAMACGAPVIGSNTSSIPEVIGRPDALFDPASVEAIVAAMTQVLLDPARQASLREHGLAQARLFSWDTSARRAIEAFEETHRRRTARGADAAPLLAEPARKPRLAYVSPLPPTRSGIAAYSADLLPELARHFDIELVLAQDRVEDMGPATHFPQHTAAWFDANAQTFDHIVYQFGNSAFHSHMFGLLERHPGVVVLHDFFLSGVIHYAEAEHELPNHYCRSLYLAHGYGALIEEKHAGRTESVVRYPSNKQVLDRATGVIVHSRHAVALADRWYGAGYGDQWRVLPLVCLRPGPDTADRTQVRADLGFGPGDYVVCSFGILSATKCNDRLVEAWIDSTLEHDPRCHLVFVGEIAQGRFGIALRDRIAAHPRIKVTGYADTPFYRRYLAAADAAVQLRGSSRGETSGAVFDCLSYGLPTIVNAHGSAAEVPEQACLRLEDAFTQEALRAALERMHGDIGLRARLGNAAAAYMEQTHTPARIAALYRDAITQFARDSRGQAEQDLIASIAASSAEVAASDLMQAAAAIAANRPRSGARQVLVDIDTAGMEPAVLRTLLTQAPHGWRIEPVRHDGARHRYARRFTLDLIGRPDLRIEDAVAEAGPGDVWLTLGESKLGTVPAKWLARGVLACCLDPSDAAGEDGLAQRLAALADARPCAG
ncbi:glycosyltransferase [Massilia litorea]|uniref:Glycosyltransferase n=1 Tax=Massilia litorea TaxID=2769491 RepID=A0A7L9UBI8_9BURK|nr:glycosyltransferase [Massilia litorea]QOL51486.1 glycosyltransferase [Massilia litorea]